MLRNKAQSRRTGKEIKGSYSSGSIPSPRQVTKLQERISWYEQAYSRKNPSVGSLKMLSGMSLYQNGSVLRSLHL